MGVGLCSQRMGTELVGIPAAPNLCPARKDGWVQHSRCCGSSHMDQRSLPPRLSKASSCPGSWQVFLHLQE